MKNLDDPTGESAIQRRDLVPAGFREWKEADLRSFGTSLEELARRCVPGTFIRVNDKVYFSRGAADSMSCR